MNLRHGRGDGLWNRLDFQRLPVRHCNSKELRKGVPDLLLLGDIMPLKKAEALRANRWTPRPRPRPRTRSEGPGVDLRPNLRHGGVHDALQHRLAGERGLVPGDAQRRHREADRALDVRLRERGLHAHAQRDVGAGEELALPVVPAEAPEELDGLEGAALVQGDGEQVVCADEAGKVDNADGVDGSERGRGCGGFCVGGEVGGVVSSEEGERCVQEVVELVLMAQPDACGDRLVRGTRVRGKGPEELLECTTK